MKKVFVTCACLLALVLAIWLFAKNDSLVRMLSFSQAIDGNQNLNVSGSHNNIVVSQAKALSKVSKTEKIKSDLRTPVFALLERPNIIKKINKHFQDTKGIKTIALTGIIGIGGAGKTTIARHYGKNFSNDQIVWEVNAESEETLLNSITDLGYALATEEDLKQELTMIMQISSKELQGKQLLRFLQNQLKQRNSWLLIYDNVESFAKINKYFPHDVDQWGNGKVIITTRNQNIANGSNNIKPENVIHIDELEEDEKLFLFTKILYDKDPSMLSIEEKNKIKDFLGKIPPFPLDISIAAITTKNMNLTLDEYNNKIKDYTDNYNSIQSSWLIDITDYSKTRYGIISSAIEKFNKLDARFRSMFFFICSIDSQNITYDMIAKYANGNNDVVNMFIYNLRKNGLLLRTSSSNLTKDNQVISIHRSTHDFGKLFLDNHLTVESKQSHIERAKIALEDFYNTVSQTGDIKSALMLIPHIKSFISTIDTADIPDDRKFKYQADLYCLLATINHEWEKNLADARINFRIALERNKSSNHFSTIKLATILKNLGMVSSVTNYPDDAIAYCNESNAIASNLANADLILIENFQILGASYRKKGDFHDSEKYLHKALSTAINIMPHKMDLKLKNIISEIYTQLCHLYICHYINKKEADISDEYYQNALKLIDGFTMFHLTKGSLPHIVGCNVARQQLKYSHFFVLHEGNNQVAKNWIESALYILSAKCPQDKYLHGRLLGSLGEALLRQNDLEHAFHALQDSVNFLGLMLGEKSMWFERVIKVEILVRLKRFKEAYEEVTAILDLKGNVERNNLHDLRYYTAHYHAGYIQYRRGYYEKSLGHFEDFIRTMDFFCQKFFNDKEYRKLLEKNIFITFKYSQESVLDSIKLYLDHALGIFTAIYGPDHPFVTDYILQNVQYQDINVR